MIRACRTIVERAMAGVFLWQRHRMHWEELLWDMVVSPGLLFSAGAAQVLRNQMALFCFPDESAQPLARSQTNTVKRVGGEQEVMFVWENERHAHNFLF